MLKTIFDVNGANCDVQTFSKLKVTKIRVIPPNHECQRLAEIKFILLKINFI